jgi:hypothetical protein
MADRNRATRSSRVLEFAFLHPLFCTRFSDGKLGGGHTLRLQWGGTFKGVHSSWDRDSRLVSN